jgi:hypothetical protein
LVPRPQQCVVVFHPLRETPTEATFFVLIKE